MFPCNVDADGGKYEIEMRYFTGIASDRFMGQVLTSEHRNYN